MGKYRLFDRIIAALLGVLAAFGGMGVLASGMRFYETSITPLLLLFSVCCLIFAFFTGTKLFPLFPVLLTVVCFWLWRAGSLEPALEAFLHQLSTIYDMGYHCGLIRWTDTPIVQSNSILIFGILGLWIGMAVTWTAIKGRSAWLAVFLVFAPLVPCIVFTDTVPSPVYLFLQLLSILLLLLTQITRKRNPRQGGKLLVLLFLPVTLALGGLFLLMPQTDYQGQVYAQEMETFFLQLFNISPKEDVPVETPPVATETVSRVHLTTVGPKAVLWTPVMTVTSQETGILYLRSTSYDTYRGTHWDEDVLDNRFAFYNHGGAPKKVTITTRNIHDVLFLPYAPMTVTADGDIIANNIMGKLENEDSLREYTVTYSPVTYLEPLGRPLNTDDRFLLIYQDGTPIIVDRAEPSTQALVRYRQLDEITRLEAEKLLVQNIPELETMEYNWDKAQAIAEFVRNSATYDLRTPRMPDDCDDFALWFLTESDTGYCTHFATAATVLLRAAGIPARYATGYLVRTQADTAVTVVQKNSHAWTEVYIDGYGWVVLDATPSGGIQETAGPEPTDPVETTAPPETTAPEETDPSTEATDPEENTFPTESTPFQEDPLSTKPSVPSQNTGNSEDPSDPTTPDQRKPFVLPQWAKSLLWLLAAAAVVVGQWKLRVLLRNRRHTRGANNTRVLSMWRDIELYARLLDTEPEESLLALARKARFSQHRLTKKEVFTMELGMKMLRRSLWNAGKSYGWKRLYAQLILALY